MGPVDSDRLSRVRSYSGAGAQTFSFGLRDFHRLWSPIPERSTRVVVCAMPVLQPQPDESGWFGLFRVRSPLLTESRLLSFPPGSEMFQFPGFAPHAYGLSVR